MDLEFLQKFEGQRVRLLLKNHFTYSDVVFNITEDNLLEFVDRFGEMVVLDPSYISGITKISEQKRDEVPK